MKNLKFFTSVIFLLSVFVLVGLAGKAHALFWKGFSELCYEADLKGSPDTELSLKIVNLKIQAGCLNERDNSINCKSGEGNSGSFTINAFPTTSVNSDKDKNIVHISGCIGLSKYDHHYGYPTCTSSNPPGDESCHQHVCYPYDNPNKVEILNSAYVSNIDVYYDVINTNNNQIKYSAHQICNWPGTIDSYCIPQHDVYFTCSEEQIINK